VPAEGRDISSRGLDARRSRFSPHEFAGFAICVALWFLLRPYHGIKHDAVIYMGRGLADLDPDGVGRDFMFRLDGQSKFSIFSKIVDALIPLLGLGSTATFLTLAGLALWLAAMTTLAHTTMLAHRVAGGRKVWALLLLVAWFDSSYGASGIFAFAEAFATPRPFAEAFVLAALAALISDRRWVALALLVVAAAFHPIMAAPGFLVLYLYECRRDPRWLVLALIGAAGLAAAVALGAPIAGRLTVRVDPEWAEILVQRSDYLFIADWSASDWATILRQASTLLLAASLAPANVRRLLVCALATALLGVSASFLFGDLLLRELAVQAQAWRALWLTAALSPLAFGVGAVALWGKGPQGRIVLALMAVGWILRDEPESAALCLFALLAFVRRDSWSGASLAVLERAAWTLCALAGAAMFASSVWLVREYFSAAPPGDTARLAFFLANGAIFLPIVFAAVAILVGLWTPKPLQIYFAGALSLAAAAVCWNDEPPYSRHLTANSHPPELEAIVKERAGETLWVNDNLAPWVFLGRAGWASRVQGAGAVFSRTQAVLWRERMGALHALGWVSDSALSATTKTNVEFPPFTRASLDAVCGRADAPAWVIGPVPEPSALPAGLEARFWRGPLLYSVQPAGEGLRWTPIEHYAVFDCAAYRPE
jgi:hypothetical protein